MTANHAHTPTKADLKKAWDFYRAAQANATSRPPNYRAYRLEFLRAWDEINTAAEQRGAIKALREARSDWFQYADAINDTPSKYYPALWLKNRADQMEGDDAN